MATQVQLRGGTTSEHSTFTGAVREVTVDTTKDTVVVHDGSTAGGIPLAKEASVLPLAGGTMTGDVSLGDNVKAKFGAGDDLQIYHDGANSYIQDAGTGSLYIKADNDIFLSRNGNTEVYLKCRIDGAVTLYHNDNEKLATTSTGVDVTGSVTCDDFTSTGIDDNATSTAITIDASENVGIGNNSPSNNHANANNLVVGNGTAGGIANYVGTGLGWYAFSRDNANNSDAFDGGISYDGSRNLMFHTNAGSERMRIDSTGNVKVNTGNLVIGTSGKGIDFSADANNANMTSEVLDDYEEGTWTPEYGCSTTDPSGVTYDNVVFGTYVKIGKQVFISGGIRHDGMSSAGSGSLLIKGFPFSAESSSGGGTPRYALSVSQAESWSDLHPVSMFMRYGGDTADILTAASSTNPQKGRTNLYHTDLQTSGTNQDLITFFGHYQVA